MQSVKLVMRQIGVPNGEFGVVSVAEVEDYIEYKLTSDGYTLQATHYLGDVRNGADVLGYKVLFVFTKYSDFLGVTETKVPAKKNSKVLDEIKVS